MPRKSFGLEYYNINNSSYSAANLKILLSLTYFVPKGTVYHTSWKRDDIIHEALQIMNPNDSEMQMKQTRQNSSNKKQPHKTTQIRGDATSNRQHATHQTRQKRKDPCQISFSHAREDGCLFLLVVQFRLSNYKTYRPTKKWKITWTVKKCRKNRCYLLPVTCCIIQNRRELHEAKTEKHCLPLPNEERYRR